MLSGFICADMSVMARRSLRKLDQEGDVTPGRVGGTGAPGTSRRITRLEITRLEIIRLGCSLHIVVVRILADIADIENDHLGTEVLPPMRGAEHLGSDIAGLVQNGLRAVAGVFNDLALLHKNESGPIVVAVPWHDAAGLDRELAEAQLAVPEVRRLLFEVNRAQRHVGYADRLEFDFLAGVGLHLVGGTFAGE